MDNATIEVGGVRVHICVEQGGLCDAAVREVGNVEKESADRFELLQAKEEACSNLRAECRRLKRDLELSQEMYKSVCKGVVWKKVTLEEDNLETDSRDVDWAAMTPEEPPKGNGAVLRVWRHFTKLRSEHGDLEKAFFGLEKLVETYRKDYCDLNRRFVELASGDCGMCAHICLEAGVPFPVECVECEQNERGFYTNFEEKQPK